MEKRSNTDIKNKITNFFGGIGYLACSVQWFWTIILFIEPIKSFVGIFTPKTESIVNESPIIIPENNPALAIISIIITILVIGLSIFLIYKVPASIATNSKKIVHETTDKVLPLVIKATHHKETKKIIFKFTARILIAIKIVLIVFPILLILFSGLMDKQVFDMKISITVGIFLAIVSMLWFGIEYLLAKIFGIKFNEIW